MGRQVRSQVSLENDYIGFRNYALRQSVFLGKIKNNDVGTSPSGNEPTLNAIMDGSDYQYNYHNTGYADDWMADHDHEASDESMWPIMTLKGKGKGNFSGLCYECGKPGHRAA